MAVQPVYYELYDSGEHIGRYTSSELMSMLDIHHRQLITYYINTGHEYMGRYLFERSEKAIREGWAAEWDCVRIEVLELISNLISGAEKMTN